MLSFRNSGWATFHLYIFMHTAFAMSYTCALWFYSRFRFFFLYFFLVQNVSFKMFWKQFRNAIEILTPSQVLEYLQFFFFFLPGSKPSNCSEIVRIILRDMKTWLTLLLTTVICLPFYQVV